MSHFQLRHLAFITGASMYRLVRYPLHSLFFQASIQLFLILASGPQDISQFFGNLYNDLTVFALSVAGFFFAWAALLYIASGAESEKGKQHAQAALVAALAGLALALLAQLIAGLVMSAVPSQDIPTPIPTPAQ